jgi:hypothetical protein
MRTVDRRAPNRVTRVRGDRRPSRLAVHGLQHDSFLELARVDDAASPAMASRLGTIPFQA